MANARINTFLYPELFHFAAVLGDDARTLKIWGVDTPGSLSFNNLAILLSRGHTSASVTYSFGLYSMNVGTLSLANSGSMVETNGANGISWRTLATSATQDITPGNWYFAMLKATAGNTSIAAWGYNGIGGATDTAYDYAGSFVLGVYSVTTSGLPSAINTSEMFKVPHATTSDDEIPYILISA